MPRGNNISRYVPEGYMTTGEVAKLAGVFDRTIHNWTRTGWLTCKVLMIGKLTIRIFNEAEQARAVRLAMTHKNRPLRERHIQLRTNPDGTKRKVRALPRTIPEDIAKLNH